jgi:hypothetical protein
MTRNQDVKDQARAVWRGVKTVGEAAWRVAGLFATLAQAAWVWAWPVLRRGVHASMRTVRAAIAAVRSMGAGGRIAVGSGVVTLAVAGLVVPSVAALGNDDGTTALGALPTWARYEISGGRTEPTRASTSRYVSWMKGDPWVDAKEAERLGCEAAKREKRGVVVLAFGKQTGGGTKSFARGNVKRTYEHLAGVAVGYAGGLNTCSNGRWVVMVATSNYRLDDVALGAQYGAEWREFVRGVRDTVHGYTDRVEIVGGWDLEPGWGGMAAAEAWAQAYAATGDVALWSNPSADGCPKRGEGGPCANGWNTSVLARLVWGVPSGTAVPQIYRLDGVQAQQWGVLARVWERTGGTAVFAGAMTQQGACDQVRNRTCPQLYNSPEQARQQLADATGKRIALGTDVRWG